MTMTLSEIRKLNHVFHMFPISIRVICPLDKPPRAYPKNTGDAANEQDPPLGLEKVTIPHWNLEEW